MQNIVLIMGTFNPVTNAHIGLGKQITEYFKGNCKVIYVPAKDNFLKSWKNLKDNGILSEEIRLSLLKEAVEPEGFEVSDIEIREYTNGKTYNTVNYIKKQYHTDNIYICMGTDKIEELDRWYEAEKLISENKFLVIKRDNKSLEDVIMTSKLAKKYANNFFSIKENEYQTTSSTNIREAYIKGTLEKVKKDIPANIYKFLTENQQVYV